MKSGALFITEGELQIGGEVNGVGDSISRGRDAGAGQGRRGDAVRAMEPARARVMLFGGAPLDGPRHIWWNFVSSSRERIERAKQEWKDGAFGLIPGDDQEFIPLLRGAKMKSAVDGLFYNPAS